MSGIGQFLVRKSDTTQAEWQRLRDAESAAATAAALRATEATEPVPCQTSDWAQPAVACEAAERQNTPSKYQ